MIEERQNKKKAEQGQEEKEGKKTGEKISMAEKLTRWFRQILWNDLRRCKYCGKLKWLSRHGWLKHEEQCRKEHGKK